MFRAVFGSLSDREYQEEVMAVTETPSSPIERRDVEKTAIFKAGEVDVVTHDVTGLAESKNNGQVAEHETNKMATDEDFHC